MIPRILEPEAMDTDQDATEYDRMDHAEVNRLFVADLLDFANQTVNQYGSIGTVVVDDPEENELSLSDDVSEKLQSLPLGDVLDVGTGTALIPVELCHRNQNCRVMATDMATSMLNLAVYHLERAGLRDRITLTQIDAKKMPYPDHFFDVVMSNSIVHHIPEPSTVLNEIHRVLRPGGILFLRDLFRPHDLETLNQLVATYAGQETDYSRKLFFDSLHASLTVAEMQAMVQELGYPAETVKATSDRHWTWAARKES